MRKLCKNNTKNVTTDENVNSQMPETRQTPNSIKTKMPNGSQDKAKFETKLSNAISNNKNLLC